MIFNLDDAFAAFVLQILTDKLRAVIVTDYGSVSALVGGLFCVALHTTCYDGSENSLRRRTSDPFYFYECRYYPA